MSQIGIYFKMNWQTARRLAKITNILFLILVFFLVWKIYLNEKSENPITLVKNDESKIKSVFYYDFESLINIYSKNNQEKNLRNLLVFKDDIKAHKNKKFIDEIINHRLSLIYLTTILFGDFLKLILGIGIL